MQQSSIAKDGLGVRPERDESVYTVQAVQMLRTVQSNTLALSQMADQKASILMGATFLVFSIAVGRALSGEVPHALAVLAVFSFLSSLCAVMAVMPSVGKAPQGVRPNRVFFGHFSELDEDDWTSDMLEQLRTDETTLRVMLHDIYQNGQVLHRRKYRYLRYAYRVFVVGLVATLATFGLESIAAG